MPYLVYTSSVRSRELWLWLGGACLTLGALSAAIALAYFTKEQRFSLYKSWQMILAAVLFASAFGCFLSAIIGWRFWSRKSRFPDIEVHIVDVGALDMSFKPMPDEEPDFVVPRQLRLFKVHLTSRESEQRVSIRSVVLFAKLKPGDPWPWNETMFTHPRWPIPPSANLQPMSFPVNLEPQEGRGGDLVFDLADYWPARLADPFDAWLEVEDSAAGKLANCPAAIGTYYREHGLWETTAEQRLTLAGRHDKKGGPDIQD